jgi:hypothetical protein
MYRPLSLVVQDHQHAVLPQHWREYQQILDMPGWISEAVRSHIMGNNIKRGKAFTCLFRAVFRIHSSVLIYCSRRMLKASHPLTLRVRCSKIKFIFNRCEHISDRLLPNTKKDSNTLGGTFPIGLHSTLRLLPGLQWHNSWGQHLKPGSGTDWYILYSQTSSKWILY